MNAEQNYRLLCEIEANRAMMLQVYRQNPQLLVLAEPRIHLMIGLPPSEVREVFAEADSKASRCGFPD